MNWQSHSTGLSKTRTAQVFTIYYCPDMVPVRMCKSSMIDHFKLTLLFPCRQALEIFIMRVLSQGFPSQLFPGYARSCERHRTRPFMQYCGHSIKALNSCQRVMLNIGYLFRCKFVGLVSDPVIVPGTYGFLMLYPHICSPFLQFSLCQYERITQDNAVRKLHHDGIMRLCIKLLLRITESLKKELTQKRPVIGKVVHIQVQIPSYVLPDPAQAIHALQRAVPVQRDDVLPESPD